MPVHKDEILKCERIAQVMGLNSTDVLKAVRSFFGDIRRKAAALPYNDERRIYVKDVFEEQAFVVNIPYIGRIGPVYSRYLKWRENEARTSGQQLRDLVIEEYTAEQMDDLAKKILAGGNVILPKKNKNSELYNRIWIVSKHGKKMARQVLPKKQK